MRVDAALTCATDAKMVRAGAHPALGPLPAPLGHEVGRDGARGRRRRAPARGRRRRRGRQLGALRRCAGLPRGAREPLRVDRLPHRGVRRAPARARARSSRATRSPLPAGLAPALGAMAEPLACALHSAGRCGARARRRRPDARRRGAGPAPGRRPGRARVPGAPRRPPPRAPRACRCGSAPRPPTRRRATTEGVAALRRALPGGRGADVGGGGRRAARDLAGGGRARAAGRRGAAARRLPAGERGDAARPGRSTTRSSRSAARTTTRRTPCGPPSSCSPRARCRSPSCSGSRSGSPTWRGSSTRERGAKRPVLP